MSAAELQTYKDSAGTYQPEQNYNKIVTGYGTGLHPPTEEGWSEIAENAYIVEKINYQTTLPAAVDHTTDPWFPPIGDQGQQGSCASFGSWILLQDLSGSKRAFMGPLRGDMDWRSSRRQHFRRLSKHGYESSVCLRLNQRRQGCWLRLRNTHSAGF